MRKPQHIPSLMGCAAGFGAAGTGVGSLCGTFLWSLWVPELPEKKGTGTERAWNAYGGTFLGIYIGFVLGALIGVVYARWKRKTIR